MKYLLDTNACIRNDLMIAAIALANELVLVTHNVAEFGRVPELRIEDWEPD